MGDDEQCLSVLSEAPGVPKDSKVAEALGFNTALCGGSCNIHADPGCLEGRNALVEQQRATDVEEGFMVPACDIRDAGPDALKIAPPNKRVSQMCVSLIPAHSEELKDPDPETGMSERITCPKLSISEFLSNGRIRKKELTFDGGKVADPSDCCNFRSLSLKQRKGTTWIRLEGSGRDCFGGTASWTYDEIYLLDKDGLTLDRDHNFAWH